jgi:hypothetical protein
MSERIHEWQIMSSSSYEKVVVRSYPESVDPRAMVKVDNVWMSRRRCHELMDALQEALVTLPSEVKL